MITSKYDSDPDQGQDSRAGSFLGWTEGSLVFWGLIGLICFLMVGYQVENWRGKRAWRSCKRELESKGNTMDWQTFIPVTVPASLNAFRAPMMSEWFRSSGGLGDLYRRMNTEAVFGCAGDVFPPLAEITVMPLAEDSASTDAALDLEYRCGVLDLYSAKKESAVSNQCESLPMIKLDRVPLSDAIKNLARQAGLSYLIDPQVDFLRCGPDGGTRGQPVVTIQFEYVTVFQALEAVLAEHKLQWIRDPESGIARITWKGAPQQFSLWPWRTPAG